MISNKLKYLISVISVVFCINSSRADIPENKESGFFLSGKSDPKTERPNEQADSSLSILELKPTIFFPKTKEGEPLKQKAELVLDCREELQNVSVKVLVAGKEEILEEIGDIVPGRNVKPILVPDINKPIQITIELYQAGNPQEWLQWQWQCG